MRLPKLFTKAKNKKFPVLVSALVAVAGFAMLALASPAPQVSATGTCDSGNDIIPGGFSTPTDFINKVNSKTEYQNIYADSRFGNGLSKAQYDDFKAHAKHGYTDINGGIYLDNGTKVGSNAGSIGREPGCQGPSAQVKTFTIAGNHYYGSLNTYSINHDTPRLAVYILLNSQGKATFAVMTSCGNPMYFPPPPPPPPQQTAKCVVLNVVGDKNNPQTYTFTTSTTVTGGAKINDVVYDFGDNHTDKESSPGKTVTHNYTNGGTFTAKVTLHATVNGKSTTIAPADKCIKKVTVPKPNYACVSLKGVLSDKSKNVYTLTATASFGSGVSPTSADFDFGDGQHKNGVKFSGKTATTSHDYADINKTYTAQATLHFNAFGKGVTAPVCKTPIPVTVPYCISLAGAIIDKAKYEAQFTATAQLNGRVLQSADFVFGDGKSQNGVKPPAGSNNTVVVTHDYPGSGTFNASATLHFLADGKPETAPACSAKVTPEKVVPECKPNVPVGDVRCNPCPTNPNFSADDTEHCVAPQANLPNTGAGNTIAIFSAVVVGGFLIYRQVLYRRHKAAFVAAEQGFSVLPLGDPLNDDTPLQDTPLEPAKRSFRRRRQF